MYLCCTNHHANAMSFNNGKTAPTLILIVALAHHNAMGKGNQLLCHLTEDLAYFKRITMGATLLMGRRTFESIGRPLPGRTTVVLSTQRALSLPSEVRIVHTVDEFLALASQLGRVFVAGGAQIYKLLFPYVTECLITRIDADFDADTFFPCELLPDEWNLVEASEWKTSKNGICFRFEHYVRTNPHA